MDLLVKILFLIYHPSDYQKIRSTEEMILLPKNGKNLKELPGCIGSKEQQESSMRITQSPKIRMESIRPDQIKPLEEREVRSN